MFLLAVDAHSKWGEIHEMSQTTATKTISQLRQMFAAYGLPDQIVSEMVHNLFLTSFESSCKLTEYGTSDVHHTILNQTGCLKDSSGHLRKP